jgi:hypothetical protein
VLNPLFLDDLRARLLEAEDNPRKLLNQRNRMAKIRVFDPACGSGNFLVIERELTTVERLFSQRRYCLLDLNRVQVVALLLVQPRWSIPTP